MDVQEVIVGEVALVDPVALELLIDQLAEGVHADLVDQHLDPGAHAVLAQPVLAVEDPQGGLRPLQVVAVVELDELVEGGGDSGLDRGTTADLDLDTADLLAVDLLDLGDEADVVDLGDRPVRVARAEGRLHLARHQLRGRVADEIAGVGGRVRGDVEGLVIRDAGPRVTGDVADRVAAALAGGETRLADLPDELGGVRERNVVDLDVLAGGDVALVERRELLDRVGEGLHLLGADAAVGKLHADHLDVGLALAVDALLEAEADELLLGLLASQEAGGLRVEVVELALEDRDHVAGDVLVDLGVLQRADSALAVLLLPRVLLEGRGVDRFLGGGAVAGDCLLGRGGDGLHVEFLPLVDVPGLGIPRERNVPNLIEFQVFRVP